MLKHGYTTLNCSMFFVAALERSDNVVDRGHAFAVLKRGYTTARKFGAAEL